MARLKKKPPSARPSPVTDEIRQAPGKRLLERRVVLQWKVLVVTALVCAVVVPAVVFWHARQTYALASAYLQRARQLEQATDWNGAAQVYHRYLQLRPDDSQARLLLAGALDQSGNEFTAKHRALDYYRYVLGLMPHDVAVHQRVTELLLEVGRYTAAEDHARSLLSMSPGNPIGLRVIALAMHKSSRYDNKNSLTKLIDAYRAAEAADPHRVELYVNHAELCRENEAVDFAKESYFRQADEIMDRLIATNGDTAEARLARHAYCVRYDLPKQDEDLDEAMRIAPQDLEVLLAAAERECRKRQFDKALGFFERAIVSTPKDRRAYLRLSDLAVNRADYKAAEEILLNGLKAVAPDDLAICAQLAAVLIERSEVVEAEKYLARMESVAQRISPRLPTADRRQLKCGLQWIRANWLIAKGEFTPAIDQIRQVLITHEEESSVIETGATLAEVYGALGECYLANQAWDLAADAFVQASVKNPLTAKYLVAAASAYEASGRLAEAARYYERAVKVVDVHPEAFTALARSYYMLELDKQAKDRNWFAFQQALHAAQKKPNVTLSMLEAEFAAVMGKQQEAETILANARRDFADDPRLANALFATYRRLGKPERSLEVLQLDAEDDSPALAILEAELMCANKDLAAAREFLIRRFPPERRPYEVEVAVAELLIRDNRTAEGAAEFYRLAKIPSAPTQVIVRAGDVALSENNATEAEQLERILVQKEGAEGCLWRDLRFRRLLSGIVDPRSADLGELDSLLRDVTSRRPNWPRTHVLRGMLFAARGKQEETIAAYAKAMELGERDVAVLQELATRLFQVNRIRDAEQLLRQVSNQWQAAPRLSSAAVTAHLRAGDLTTATEIAKATTLARPNDPAAAIWLGQLLMLGGDKTAALKEVERAVAIGPRDPRTWLSLLALEARKGDIEAARKTFETMQVKIDATPGQRSFAIAQGHAILGDLSEARAGYIEALRHMPQDTAVQQAYSAFLLAVDPTGAERELRQMLGSSTSGPARRALASILAARGGEAAWQEAIALLNEDNASGATSDADLRLKALLLARRGTAENRREAIAILEGLIHRTYHVLPGDRLLLAKLYDEGDKDASACEQLKMLSTLTDPDPAHVAYYADLLHRTGKRDEALRQIEWLEKKSTNSLLSVPLRAQLLRTDGKTDQIPPLVDGWLSGYQKNARTDDEKLGGMLHAAAIYSSVEQADRAEALYRRAYELSAGNVRYLARHLAFTGKVKESVEFCLTAAEAQLDADRVQVLCAALSRLRDAGELAGRCDAVILAAQEKFAQDADVLTAIATLYYFQERYEEAIGLYEKILATAPQNWQVYNNLANLLSERPGRRRDALRYAQKAIELQGPIPELLDTLGVSLLRNGDTAEAIKVLHSAAYSPHQDPRYHFHLAVAYQKAGAINQARSELEESRKSNLNEAALTPVDRVALAELTRLTSIQK